MDTDGTTSDGVDMEADVVFILIHLVEIEAFDGPPTPPPAVTGQAAAAAAPAAASPEAVAG